jgi:hypothetical protein
MAMTCKSVSITPQIRGVKEPSAENALILIAHPGDNILIKQRWAPLRRDCWRVIRSETAALRLSLEKPTKWTARD